MTIGGSASLTASTIKIVGNYSTNGNPSLSPTPSVGQAVTPDPYAGVSAPAVPSRCDSTGISAGQTLTMPAGIFVVCGGFSMTGNS